MVIEQGDIIKFDFNPALGHEQQGYRPALVISNAAYNKYTNLLMVVPISSRESDFPLHIHLDDRTETKGVMMCEQIKAIDKTIRKIKKVEPVPRDILEHVVAMIKGEIDVVKN